jgi:hypothetical protein
MLSASASARVTPQDVVRAYVHDLDTHDVAAAESLLSAHQAKVVESEQDGWFTNVVSITDLSLGEPIPEKGPGSQGQGYSQVVRVPVQFTLKQKNPASMPDGHHVWGYLLARNSDAEPWIIVDEGPV